MTGSCKSDKWERRTRRIRVRQQSRECANSAAMNFSEDKHVLCAAGCVQADRSTSKKVCDSEGTNSEQTLCLSFKLVILSFPSGWGEKMSPIYYNSQRRRCRWLVSRERIPTNANATKAFDSQGVEKHNVTPHSSRDS